MLGTLKKINDNKVVSSEGFTFEIINTEFCLYAEGSFSIQVKWFFDPKLKHFYFDKFSVHTWGSPVNTKMSDDEIIRVNENLQRALDFLCRELNLLV